MRATLLCRRQLVAGGAAAAGAAILPGISRAQGVREITWDDLIPQGVAYPEIVGPGYMDEAGDIWRPEFDANAIRMNPELDGARVKLPGYMIPITTTADGVTEFILVPYVGACIHVPPPPPNQLVFVDAGAPWPGEDLWTALWVTGTLRARLQSTSVAEVGYHLSADVIEEYQWM